MKKFLLFLFIAACILSGSVLAEEPEWVYSLSKSEISRYNGLGGDIVIPDTVDGYAVTALGNQVLYGSDANSVTFPDTLRSLGESNLSGLTKLTAVTLPEGLQVIEGENIFSLPGLTELVIPASVAVIERSVCWCDNLRAVTFLGVCPDFVEPDFCFSVLPDDLTVFVPDDQLEAYRAALVNLRPEQVQPSGQNAVPVDYTPAADELTFDAATGTVELYSGASYRVDIPAAIDGVPVRAIGDSAFEDSRVACVVLPEGLEEIGDMAFDGAGDLRVVKMPESLRRVGDYAFNSTLLNALKWNQGLEEIGENAFRYTELGLNMELPESLQVIGENAFYGASIRDVHIGGSIRSIGAGAFKRTNLKYLMIDVYQMIEVGEEAFAGTWLEDIDLPWDTDPDSQRAWQELIDTQVTGCKVWINNPPDCETPAYGTDTYAEYPDGTLYWQSYTGDQEALVPWHSWEGVQVTGLGDGVFKGNQTLKKFRVSHSDQFTTIGAEAFAGSVVETVDLYCTTEVIGDGAFRDCLGLTAITLPASLKQIGAGAFAGCANLLDVTVLCDPAILPEGVFDGTAYAQAQQQAAPVAAPIDRLEDVFGTWKIAAMAEDGEEFSVAFLGLKMYLTVNADGTASLVMEDEDTTELFWYQENGVLWLGAEDEYSTSVGLDDQGRLCLYQDDGAMIFTRYDASSPQPTPAPAANFAPITEVDGLLGTWSIQAMAENGEEMDVSSFGLEMYFTLNADGTAVLIMDAEDETPLEWKLEDGALAVGMEDEITTVTLDDQGRLWLYMGDEAAIFVKADASALPQVTPEPQIAVTVSDSLLPYTGTWYAILLDSGIAPMDAHGLDIVLTLNADGTGYFSFDESSEAFHEQDGQAFYGDMPVTLREDGRLMYGSPRQGAIYFSRDPQDVMAETEMATVAPIAIQTPAPAAPQQASGEGGPRMDVKYLAVTYTAAGYTMDASILGSEYFLTFHTGGQCSMVTGGMPMPTLTWLDNGDGTLTLDYMGALTYTAVMNGDSLDVDLGGMVLTYAPQD